MAANGNEAGSDRPGEQIDRLLDETFFRKLEKSFGKQFGEPAIQAELKNIGRLYLIFRNTENSLAERRAIRRNSLRLAKQTGEYLNYLRDAPYDDISMALYVAALRRGEPVPTTKFPKLTTHTQENSGEPYLLELIRLLELLSDANLEQAERFREKPGPKSNFALELLVRRVGDIFDALKRSFSIDHHKPVPTGPAIEFVRDLVAPLDTISDTEIATAIRNEQSRRKKLQDRRLSPTPRNRAQNRKRSP